MLVDTVRVAWVGPTSFGVELNGATKAFSLEDGQVVPSEFKDGDLVEVHIHGDMLAVIWGIETSKGYYMFKHVPSGKEFRTWHRAEAWRFEPPSPASIS